MKLLPVVCCLASLGIALSTSAAPQASPYAGEEGRAIKSLSAEDVDALLAGKGMGLAKAAELNGYPGPLHVLELADELALTAEQRAATEALFAAMQTKAKALGGELVEAERALDRLFATKAASPELVTAALAAIGELQAKVRGAHLEAHLAQVEILTPAQTARYIELRGYDDPGAHAGHEGGHQH